MIKRSLRNFSAESDVTKLQILNTACKLYVKDPARAGPALKHVLDLCAADPSVDIRDRVRVYRAMFAVGGNATPLAVFKERVVLCEKSAPQLPPRGANLRARARLVVAHRGAPRAGVRAAPPHPTTQPPTHVRDQYFAGNQDSSKAGRSGGAFYSDDSDDSDSDSDSGAATRARTTPATTIPCPTRTPIRTPTRTPTRTMTRATTRTPTRTTTRGRRMRARRRRRRATTTGATRIRSAYGHRRVRRAVPRCAVPRRRITIRRAKMCSGARRDDETPASETTRSQAARVRCAV